MLAMTPQNREVDLACLLPSFAPSWVPSPGASFGAELCATVYCYREGKPHWRGMKQNSGGGVGGEMNQTELMQDPFFFFFCFTPQVEDPFAACAQQKTRLVRLFAEFNSSFAPLCFPYKKKKGKGLTRGENDAVTDPSSIEKAVAQTGCDCLIFFFFFFFRAQGAAERTKKIYLHTHTPEGKRRLLSMNERC